MNPFHSGPTTPTSLNGVNNVEIALPKTERIVIQARLFSNTAAVMHFRIAYAASGSATTLATAEHSLGHLGSRSVCIYPDRQAYLYVYTTNAAGTAATMGANDYVSVLTGSE